MLNKLRKSKLAVTIREKLLTIPTINHRVKTCLVEHEAQRISRETKRIERGIERYHLNWALIMSGQTMRDIKTDHRTLADITDAGVTVSYMNGREVGQEHAGPTFHRFDTLNWGGM